MNVKEQRSLEIIRELAALGIPPHERARRAREQIEAEEREQQTKNEISPTPVVAADQHGNSEMSETQDADRNGQARRNPRMSTSPKSTGSGTNAKRTPPSLSLEGSGASQQSRTEARPSLRLPQSPGYERLLTEDEAIDRLGLHDRRNPRGALRWLIRRRKLACVRLGRGILRFRPNDIDACINRQHHDTH